MYVIILSVTLSCVCRFEHIFLVLRSSICLLPCLSRAPFSRRAASLPLWLLLARVDRAGRARSSPSFWPSHTPLLALPTLPQSSPSKSLRRPFFLLTAATGQDRGEPSLVALHPASHATTASASPPSISCTRSPGWILSAHRRHWCRLRHAAGMRGWPYTVPTQCR
jgi:hypothetical protein